MERMLAGVEIVEDNINNLVPLENEGIGIAAVNFNAVRGRPGR